MRNSLKLFCISGFLFSSRTLCKLENYIENEYDKENSFDIINNKVEKAYESGKNNNINIDKFSNRSLEVLEVKEKALVDDKKSIDNKYIEEQVTENNINFEEKILHKDICKLNKENIEKEGLYKPNTIKNIAYDSLYKKGKLNFLYEYGMELLNFNKAPMNRMNNSRGLGDSNMSFLDISNNNNNNMNSLNSPSFVEMKSIHRCIKKRGKGERDWECNKKNSKEPNVCFSDRRVQLCTGNLIDIPIKDATKEKFKEKLILAAKREGNLLFEKYGKKYNEEFCLNLKWSYGDYGDIIKGTDMEGLGRSIQVEFEIDRIFKNDKKKSEENRKNWWKEISSDIWKAMIEEHKDMLKQNIKECSGEKPSDEPQINRWLMEWVYDTNYNKDKWYKILDDTKYKCNRICPKETICKSECKKYKTWIDKKNNDFTILSEIFFKYNKTNTLYKTAFEYLKHKWDKYNELNFGSIFDQLNAKYYNKCICQNNKIENNALYVKIENICKTTEVKSIYGELYCKAKGNDKIWQCINENIKDFPDVCGPPRRQQLCLGNLDKDQFRNVKDLSVFLKEIILGIRDEGKFIIEKYKRNLGGNKHLDEKACKYLNYSFDDYKNIILGKDMWRDTNSIKTENILKGNFEAIKENIVRTYPGYADLSLDEFRKYWWDQNKSQLWEAISCEFYNLNHIGECLMEDDDDNQYLHWFREWKNDFCIEQIKWNNVIKEPCIDKKVTPSKQSGKTQDVAEACSKSCTDYDDWIINKRKEYKMQSSKYKRDRSLYNNVIKDLKPWEYLSMKCTECTCKLDTEIFAYPYKGYENICKVKVKPYDPKDIEDEEFNIPSSKVYSVGGTSKDVTAKASPGKEVLSIRETVHLEPFIPNIDNQSSYRTAVGNVNSGRSNTGNVNDRAGTRTETHTHNGGASTPPSSLGSGSRGDVSSSHVDGVKEVQKEHEAEKLLSSKRVTDEVSHSEESTLSQIVNKDIQTQSNVDGKSVTSHTNQDTEGPRITSGETPRNSLPSDTENLDLATILGESESDPTATSEDETSTMGADTDRQNKEQMSDVPVHISSETKNKDTSVLKTEETSDEEVNSIKHNNDKNLEDNSVLGREDTNAKVPSGDNTRSKENLNEAEGMVPTLEKSAISRKSERGGSDLESKSNKLNSGLYSPDKNRIETRDERNIDGLNNSYGHDRRDYQRHRVNINNRSRYGSLESDIVVGEDNRSNMDENEGEEVASTLNNPTNVLNNTENRTYNIEEYIYRDVKKVANDIMGSYRSNRCTNDLSSNYCSKLKKGSLSNVCTDEESKNLCCTISDYCMKYFNFNSSGYHSCMRKEFSNPEYKCFTRESSSNMYYFAGGGLFFIILLLMGTTSSRGKWYEENELNGTAFEEANFEDAAFEVTTGQDSAFEEYDDSAYRIGLLSNRT